MTPAEILAALQTLTQAGLTVAQVTTLLNMPQRTEADVVAQLNATDATIDQVKADD